jgi:DNA-binding transcriptional ArsR family regulator
MNAYRLPIRFLKALAHPARLEILNALREEEECVCHLTVRLCQRQAYVSQQLMLLRRAGLIEDRKDGLRVYYHIKDLRVLQVLDAVNALVGVKDAPTASRVIAVCSCPKCKSGKRLVGS